MRRGCYCFVEDEPTAAVARRLLVHRNHACNTRLVFMDGFPQVMGGFGKLKSKMNAFTNMTRAGIPVFVIADLDTTPCPPALLRSWLPKSSPMPPEFLLRVAVRQVESWVLADRDSLARFLGIPVANFPGQPDRLDDSKRALLDLIGRKGRRKWHQEMLPQSRTASIGPRYNERISVFLSNHWDPERASSRSPSLARAIKALFAL